MWRKPRTPPEPPRVVYELNDPPPTPPPATIASPSLRFRPPAYTLGESDSRLKRLLFHALALSITAAYFYFLLCFWAPAPCRPGIDENAYLVAGRMIAEHGSTSLAAPHPLSYVGAMWIQSDKSDLFYPKYPAGLSLLYAIPYFFTNHQRAADAAFLLSPVCAALAAYFLFLLTRRVAGSFHAILAMLVLACGITTLELAHIPNSHLPCLAVVTAGMYFLVRSVQSLRLRWGLLGAFLLGFAVSVRYSQGLMVLPVAAAAIFHAASRFREPKRSFSSFILQPSSLLFAWGVPVATLALFNWLTMGHLSGYDATRESTGFTFVEFLRKWEFAVAQIHSFGLFVTAPLGLVGLILLFRRHARIACLLLLWFLPGTLLYFCYYWGKQAPGVAFLRFFLDLFPPMVLAAFWLVRMAARAAALDNPRSGSIVAPLASGILCAAASAHGLWVSLPELARQHVGNLNLAYSADRLLAAAPETRPLRGDPKPVIFSDEGLFPQFLMYAQFVAHGDFFAADAFTPKFGGGFGVLGFKRAANDDSPVLIQEKRRDRNDAYYKSKSAKDLVAEQHKVMSDALAANRPVYLLLNTGQRDLFLKTFITPPFRAQQLDHWTEPAGHPVDPTNHPLSPPTWRLNLLVNWNAQSWHLYKVTRVPAVTQPTS